MARDTKNIKRRIERLEKNAQKLDEDGIDPDGHELTVSVATETDDAVEDLRELADAAKEARIEIWKLNNALAQLEDGRKTSADLME